MTENLQSQLRDLTPEQRELLSLRLRNAGRKPAHGSDGATRSPADPVPLSFTQEQLWFLDRLEPGTAVYNIPFALRLTGPLDTDALCDAVNAVVDRHEALRTVFAEGQEGLRQIIRPELRVPLPVVDLRPVPADDRQSAADRESAAHGGCSFDLSSGPLIAVRLLVLDDDDHLLLVTVHHIVFDAWSAEVFTRELAAFYAGFAAGDPVSLPPLTSQFGDHALRRRDPSAVRTLDRHLTHWRERLTGAPSVSTQPPDLPRPAVQTHRGARRSFALPAPLTRDLVELARSTGVTLNAVVLAAFAALLRQATGQDDVLFGMPAAGRPRTELEPVIGSFANMLVLRIDLSGDQTVRELISRVHGTVSDAYAHQDAPYTRVVEAVSPPRDPRLNPLFQMVVMVAEAREEQQSGAGVVFAPAPVENGLTDFDMFVTVTRHGDEIDGVLDYNADLYLGETADRTVALLPTVLADMAEGPDRNVVSVASLRRHSVALTATFTADPVRDPLEFWFRFLRLPAGVEPVAYGQMVPHLLAAGDQAATVCLVRWEDWLRHWDTSAGRAAGAGVLDAAMGDLEAAVRTHRQRSPAPLVFVVCPASPRFQVSPWTELFARLDDRLALLRARVPNTHAVWAAQQAWRYPVTETFDVAADELGHVPYTSEYFAALGTLAAREVWRASGQTARQVLVGEDSPWVDGLARLLPHRVVPCPADGLVERVGAVVAGEAAEGPVVLHPDPSKIAAVRRRYPQVVALVVPDRWEELKRFLAHVWVLDPPGGACDGLFSPMGAERAAYLAEHLAVPATIAERVVAAAARTVADERAVAPRTASEERLAALWRQALRLDNVGVTSDFFSLGGHSLLATQLLSRVQGEFGREVSLYTLFTHPTIEQLAVVLDEANEPAAEPLLPAPRGAEPMASSTQQRLWALAQLDDDVVRHNTSFAAVLRGDLDEAALRRGVTEIVHRHEVLRTTFGERQGLPAPVVRDDLDCWVEALNLSHLGGGDLDAAVRAEIDRHVSHPYDLAEGPLLRVRLVRVARDEHYLLVGMHHIICDNTSWSILFDELVALYDAFTRGQPSPLQPLLLQFSDVAFAQQDWLDSDAVRPHLAYWRDQLADVPALELPTDHERGETRSDVAGHQVHTLPAGLSSASRELARAEGVTPFTVLLAAFGLLLHQESGQSDLVVGVPTAGRDRPELERMIGCFTDLLPLRLDLAGRPSFRQLLHRVHGTALEAHRHQELPFAKIVESLRLPRDPSRHPLFQCVFNYLDLRDEAPRLSGLDVVPLEVGAAGVDFDLFLSLSWQDEDLQADLAYSADLFTPDRAIRLLTALGEVVAAGLARPDEPIGTPRRELGPWALPHTEEAPRQPVAVAASFPADDILTTLRFWSGLLRPTLSITTAPAGQVLRPLLDPYSSFGADPDGLNVVVLRWEDFLPDPDAAPPQAVSRLERVLADVCDAVQAFCARSAAPLTLAIAPASPRCSGTGWDGVLADADARLRRSCTGHRTVEVISLDAWAERYAVKQAYPGVGHGHTACTPEFSALVGTVVARQAYRRRRRPVRSLVLDPARLSLPSRLATFLRDQTRCGRQVVLTSPPTSPLLSGLVRAGALRLRTGETLAQLGALASEGVIELDSCLVLDADPAVVAAVHDAYPQVTAIVAEPGDELARFVHHLWMLDPPMPLAATAESTAAVDLLVEIAAELNEAGAIWSAAQFGYRRTAERVSAAPRTESERVLAGIWAELLHLGEVGIHDDFFEIGGDSLLAMRVVYRAAEEGISLTPRQLVAHPTIAELCVDADGPLAPAAEQGVVVGDMPLTAAQQWFFETVAPGLDHPAHFNHPYYLRLRRQVPVEQLAVAIELLAAHHDTLRLRFRRSADGAWRQGHVPPTGAVPFTSHDVSAAADPEAAMESLAAAEQVALDLTEGPTVRVTHFRTGARQPNRLLIVAHHLVVDAVSRGLLLDDLQTLCGQLGRGEPPRLPAKTTSYRAWALRLQERAASEETVAELPFWLEQVGGDDASLPPDDPSAPTTLGSLDTIAATLTGADTAALHEAARRLRVGIRDLLVWAVARAVVDRTGGTDCAVATTGHGREDLFDDLDVSRTVGWFQVLYPIRLRLDGGMDDAKSVAEVAGQLALVPRNGIGYGLLRFSCPDADMLQRLASVPPPRIAVNYMGSFGFDEVSQAGDLFDVCHAPYGPPEDESGAWPFPLDVVGSTVGDRLRIELSFGAAYRRDRVEALLADLRAHLLLLLRSTAGPAP